ncbi:hypothetical protein DBY68_012445 [Pseudocitrobacter sp. RIT415]|nr:hypothetical protein DBY68_012445 [Pseudocitrobacter sp. RIT 415]
MNKDELANNIDYHAITGANCQTIRPFCMSFSAKSMHATTVILRCDAALLWINIFPLLMC